MRYPASASALAILLFMTAGCSSTASVIPSGAVVAQARTAGVEVINRTDDVVFYFLSEEGTLALVDYFPCVTVAQCPSVEAGKTVIRPWADVIGADASKRDYRMIWWTAVTDTMGARRPGPGGSFQFQRRGPWLH